jgi:hypothetical protein
MASTKKLMLKKVSKEIMMKLRILNNHQMTTKKTPKSMLTTMNKKRLTKMNTQIIKLIHLTIKILLRVMTMNKSLKMKLSRRMVNSHKALLKLKKKDFLELQVRVAEVEALRQQASLNKNLVVLSKWEEVLQRWEDSQE